MHICMCVYAALRLKDIQNRNYTMYCSKFAHTHTIDFIFESKNENRDLNENGRGRKRDGKKEQRKKVNRREISD